MDARNEEPLVGLDELGSMLERHEGPPFAVGKGGRSPVRPLGWRGRLAIAVALLAGSGLGFGIATSVTPRGAAAQAPDGLGFLAANGWTVHQSGTEATPERPSFAIAANVRLPARDVEAVVRGTGTFGPWILRGLPSDGVVIVGSFSLRGVHEASDAGFPARSLPLRLAQATRIRASQPPRQEKLSEYQLVAAVNGYNVDLQIYFGTRAPSRALIQAAQRQVDRLIVGGAPTASRARREAVPLTPLARAERAAESRVIDRTFACATEPDGGIRKVEARGHSGIRERSAWKQLPFAVAATGGGMNFRPTAGLFENPLAWITAANPSPTTTVDREWMTVPARPAGSVGVKGTCRTTRARVPLSAGGLSGGDPGPFGEEIDCRPAPRRVLVRVRAVLQSPSTLRLRRSYLRTDVPARRAELAVRTEAGKPLVYAQVLESGRARLFTGAGCVPE
jgi:hypothetical protein